MAHFGGNLTCRGSKSDWGSYVSDTEHSAQDSMLLEWAIELRHQVHRRLEVELTSMGSGGAQRKDESAG